jgi:hypothetical protein
MFRLIKIFSHSSVYIYFVTALTLDKMICVMSVIRLIS